MLMVLLLPMLARADSERLGVVVREGARDATIVTRLRGQLADLDGVALEIDAVGDGLEPTLEGQLTTAERLGAARDARVVVWFIARGKNLAVAIATPRDHRLFVREIPAAAESVMAEAAAIAVRGAVRSIALGGTIGVEVKAVAEDVAPVDAAVDTPVDANARARQGARSAAPSRTILEAALGWQVAIDGGASRGAHALVQRTTIARGRWGASLAITLGAPLEWRAANDVALDLSRSGALLGGERRVGGGVALGIAAGALVYHRSTSSAPSGLAPTPSNSTVAFAGALEITWRAPLVAPIGIVACAGIDVVAGAPEAALARDGMVDVIDTIRAPQPRASIALEVSTW
jgi:hypothetical protein